jgi:hypothetical protein
LPQSLGFNQGVEFSPNSQLLYVSDILKTYQFDLNSPNIQASQIIVAEWDSFYSPFPPFSTLFGFSLLAPDGKIYITTGNSTDYLHAINEPDSIGIGCNLAQHAVQLPALNFNTLPNHPNYFLGPLSGTICDSLTGIINKNNNGYSLEVHPNPTTGNLSIRYSTVKNRSSLIIYNLYGAKIKEEPLSLWSQYRIVDASNLSDGVYFLKVIRDDGGSNSIKIIKAP